jgi:hypothetical protein
LEHVVEVELGEECCWFVWYDKDGVSTLPMIAVIDRGGLAKMAALMAGLVP